MKRGFMLGAAMVACIFGALLCSLQSSAKDNPGCTLQCNTDLTQCLENAPAMDTDERRALKAACQKKLEKCLSQCSEPQDSGSK